MIKNKLSQIWYADLIIALAIFSMVLVLFFTANPEMGSKEKKILQEMKMESKVVTGSLLTTGVPVNWNKSNVERIGISDGSRISNSKLTEFAAMNYTQTRSLLRTHYDYYLFFESSGNIMQINGSNGIGKPGINQANIEISDDPDQIVKHSRIVIYKDTPAKMSLLLWN